MKRIVFLLDPNAPSSARASARAACARLSSSGVLAETGFDARAFASDPLPHTETLFLADTQETLSILQEKGLAAIALQHEKNAAETFRGASYIFSEPDEVDFDSYLKAYQRCKGLPWDVLETARCRLRETTLDDVDAFYPIYADPSMTRYMEGLFPDPNDEKRYMADYIHNVYELLGFGVWTVIEKETNNVIGRAGYSVRNGFDHIELGFLTGVQWQGKGYTQEVLRAVLDYGRDELCLDAVQALVKEGNEVSLHILQKLGFTQTRRVEIEEDIYGATYAGADESGFVRVAVSPARKGAYLELLKTL